MTEAGYSLQFTSDKNNTIDQLCTNDIFVGFAGKLLFIKHVNKFIDDYNENIFGYFSKGKISNVTDDIFKKVDEKNNTDNNSYDNMYILYKGDDITLAIVNIM